MQLAAIHRFVALICVLALISLGIVPWGDFALLDTSDRLGLILLMAFMLLSERLAVGMSGVSRGSTQALTFIPLLAAVLLFGPAAPVVLMAVTGALAEFVIRRKPPLRAIFNLAQYVLSTALAGWVFTAAGGTSVVHLPSFNVQLLPFLLFLIVVMGVNQGTVLYAITLNQAGSFRETWAKFRGPTSVNALYDMLVSPLAIFVAFIYWRAGWPSLFLSLMPLLFIRHAYLNSYRLEQANHDLLKVLVKAIETRDPYTSGHSQRVASLAGLIARSLNTGAKKVETIEMAALLHDVGKIDAVYTEILRKPESLTAQEREIIESHVAKGVELLRTLTSVPEEVIAAVQHHHEREDGRGYPQGLSGDQISFGGKIIKVCDSIDAMLSDRPYRAALTLEEVREQLRLYAGVEFDAQVVSCVLASQILEQHVELARRGSLRNETRGGSSSHPIPGIRSVARRLAASR
jgi:putative nucleotidyltransferase with HDIG domain